jgi:ubiquinol-cytochrome c reductase cytochrome b subunit
MAAEPGINGFSFSEWLSRETEFDSIMNRLVDERSNSVLAWSRTTSGVITLLLLLQMVTGILLAFHYVPTVTNAYTTVAFIELVVREGSWVRSLHYHSSVLLPVALAAHLLQMTIRSAYRTNRTAWTFALVLLAFVLGAAATGYALPWDARAINGVNIAASLTGNVPLIGESALTWLINGSAITTLTLSRFYGLHVYLIPMLILLSVASRLFIFGKPDDRRDRNEVLVWAKQQFTRNSIVMGVVFLALSIFSRVFPAPFGPQLADTATYLPRPGPQFLWLFEMQKYTDGAVAAVLAIGFPMAILGGMMVLPLCLRSKAGQLKIGISIIFLGGFSVVGILTAASIYQDKSVIRISEQLAKQEQDEASFRASLFEPQIQHVERSSIKTAQDIENTEASPNFASLVSPISIPSSYAVNCSKCHGASGEGTKKFPELVGLTTREEDQLTPDMILAIINDPKAVGRSSKMPSYKNKLLDDEKQEIVSWIRSLTLRTNGGEDNPVQTARVDENKK